MRVAPIGRASQRPTGRGEGFATRRLPGGELLRVETLGRGNADCLLSIHERLGAASRLQRYLAPKHALTSHDLALLTAVDGWDHVAVVGFAGTPRLPAGVARYVRSRQSGVVEVAIEVADEWQRRGVGRLLLCELLTRAVNACIRSVSWTAFETNSAVVALSRDLCDRRCTRLGYGVVQWSAAIA